MVRSGASCSPTQLGRPCCAVLHGQREAPVNPGPPRTLGGNLGRHTLRARRRSVADSKIPSTPWENAHHRAHTEAGVVEDPSRMFLDNMIDEL